MLVQCYTMSNSSFLGSWTKAKFFWLRLSLYLLYELTQGQLKALGQWFSK